MCLQTGDIFVFSSYSNFEIEKGKWEVGDFLSKGKNKKFLYFNTEEYKKLQPGDKILLIDIKTYNELLDALNLDIKTFKRCDDFPNELELTVLYNSSLYYCNVTKNDFQKNFVKLIWMKNFLR